MKKCRTNSCGKCCYECETSSECTGNCAVNCSDYEYKDCFFYIDTDNIRIMEVDNPFM